MLQIPDPTNTVSTLHVHFFSCDPSIEALRQQKLRFRRAATLMVALSQDRPGKRLAFDRHVSTCDHFPCTKLVDCALPDNCSRREFRVATLNARTLSDPSLVDILVAQMVSLHIEALGIQETRSSFTEHDMPTGWQYASIPADNGHSGVALILSPRLAQTAKDLVTIVAHRAFAVETLDFHFVVFYAPTSEHQSEQESAYEEVATFCDAHKGVKPIILLTDANADIGHKHTESSRASSSACRFHDFLARCSLTPHVSSSKGRPMPTFYSPNRKAVIDYVCISSRWRSWFKSFASVNPAVSSDHRMLVVSLFKRFAKDTPPKSSKPPDYSTLKDPVVSQTFENNLTIPPATLSLAAQLQHFQKEAKLAIDRLPRLSNNPRRGFPWITALDEEMRKISHQANRISVEEVDAHVAAVVESRLSELNRLLEGYAAALHKEPRLAWSFVNATKRSQRDHQLSAKDPGERMQKLASHFTKLLSPSATLPPVLFQLQEPQGHFNEDVILLSELNEVISQCATGKCR